MGRPKINQPEAQCDLRARVRHMKEFGVTTLCRRMRIIRHASLIRLRSFRASETGAVAIETVLVLPVVILALIAIIDAYRYVGIGSRVDQAAHVAANAVARQEAITTGSLAQLMEMAEIISHGSDDTDVDGGFWSILSLLSNARTEDNPDGAPRVVWQATRGEGVDTACPSLVGLEGEEATLPGDVPFGPEESLATMQICYVPAPENFAGDTLSAAFLGDPILVQAFYTSRRGPTICIDC